MSFRFFLLAARVAAFALLVGQPLTACAETPPSSDAKGGIQIFMGAHQHVGIEEPDPKTTLDVAGEAKISSTGAACTTTIEGALRYASGKLQLCDGTGWRNLALESAK